ncbi:MCP four helix bundle domain-containing protein [Brevibacillus invocatus]|uniref:MCP four helix bundle domain-containing protein n=1 Tax=Brevibacillus invocatus TaxID=173959 RepID=UPI00203CE762|nr:MCP four helix bundle domain-containing protein [Brevibacillus invocatus]
MTISLLGGNKRERPKKILLGFLVLLCFVIVSGGISIFQMKQMGNKAEEIQDNWLPSVAILGEMNGQATNMPRLLNRLGLESDTTIMNEVEQEALRTLERIDQLLVDYEKLITEESTLEHQYFEDYKKSWEAYKNDVPAILSIAKESNTSLLSLQIP